MSRGEYEPHRVLEQPHPDQPAEVLAGVDVRVVEDDRHVAVAAAEQGDRLRRLELGEPDVEAGVPLGESGERRAHEGRRRRREGRQPDPPGAQTGEVGHRVLGRGQCRGDAVRVAQQQPAGLGESDPAPDPGDQGEAEVALEPADVLAHGRLRPAQGPGGGREGSPPTDLPEHQEPSRVDRRALGRGAGPGGDVSGGRVVTPT